MDDLLQGKKKWQIKEKLAEGDAGEIFLVFQKDSLSGKQIEAILKRPKQNPAHAMRQAPQIKLESEILNALQGSSVLGEESIFSIKSTDLFDQGVFTSNRPEKFFIVIEKAEGIALDKIQKIAQSGFREKELSGYTEGDQVVVSRIAKVKHIPDFVLLASVYGCLRFLDYAHSCKSIINGQEKKGIVWNDPKPNHVFWSGEKASLTIIDWGNGSFLEKDGVTENREGSASQDNIYFLKEFGKFIKDVSPSLFIELPWNLAPNHETIEIDVNILKDGLQRAINSRVVHIKDLRRKEKNILEREQGSLDKVDELLDLQEKIIEHGLLPDCKKAENFYFNLIALFAKSQQFSECDVLLDKIKSQSLFSLDKWELVNKILKYRTLVSQQDIGWSKAVVAVCDERWIEILWNLIGKTSSDIFNDIARDVRYLLFGIEKDVNFPFDALVSIRNNLSRDSSEYDKVVDFLEKWKAVPDDNWIANFNYDDDIKALKKIGLNEAQLDVLKQALKQPEIQYQTFVGEWERSNFDAAQEILRRLFVLDPDRSRLISAFDYVRDGRNWLGEFLNLTTSENVEKKGFQQRIQSLIRSVGFPLKPDSKLESLFSSGKLLKSLLGDAPWLNKRIYAIELYLSGQSGELSFYQLLKKDLQLWQEFQPLVGQDFFVNFEKKEKDRLRQQLVAKIDELYRLLKIWHPAGYLELLADVSLMPWASSYKTLLSAMRESIQGSYLNLNELQFPVEDLHYKDAINSINIVKQWDSELRNHGILSAGKFLKSYSQVKWFNVQEAVVQQGKIEPYGTFFEHIKRKKWADANLWLETTQDFEYHAELGELLNQLIFYHNKFVQNDWNCTQKEFVALNLFSFEVAKKVRAKLTLHSTNNDDFLVIALDWNLLFSMLDAMCSLTSSILKENPKQWEYQSKGVSKAFSYLDGLSNFEELITGKRVRSLEWINTFKQIIERKKTPEQVKLKPDHPLYFWLIEYCAYQQEKQQSAELIRSFILLMIIVGFLVVGGVVGGKILYTLDKWGMITGIGTEPPARIEEDEAKTHISPTAIILSTVAPISTEDDVNLSPVGTCDEYLSYLENDDWVSYEAKLMSLGQNGFNDLQKLCGFYLSYEAKMFQVKLYRLLHQLQGTDERDHIRTIQNELRMLLDQKHIPYHDLFSRRVSPESLYSSLSWLIDSTKFCAVNQGVPLLTGLSTRNEGNSILGVSLQDHLSKFVGGKDTFDAICSLNNNEPVVQPLSLNKNDGINLLQNWPIYADTAPCAYTTQDAQNLLFHFYSLGIEDKTCPLPLPLSISIGQFSYLETHLCIVENQELEDYSYGVYINSLSNSVDIGTLAADLGGNPSGDNPGCDAQQYIDAIASRTGNLLLWQIQVVDMRYDTPAYIPKDFPLFSIQILPDEIMYRPLVVGFWSQPSKTIHLIVNELFVIPLGGTP